MCKHNEVSMKKEYDYIWIGLLLGVALMLAMYSIWGGC